MKFRVQLILGLLGVSFSSFAQQQVLQYEVWTAGFVKNNGQVRDQNYRPNKEVKYVFTDGHHFNIQLKADGFSYQLFKTIAEEGLAESGVGLYDPVEETYRPSRQVTHRIDVKFAGANPEAEIIASDVSETVFNFYTTGDVTQPILNVPSCYQITYKNIYPSIDLVFDAGNHQGEPSLKYSWIVKPGGNPSRIRLEYEGQNALYSNTNGSLSISTAIGEITEGKIYAYWEDGSGDVACGYTLSGNRVAYDLKGKVDKTLVIDPNIIWAVNYGGENDEFCAEGDLAIDTKNNAIITGNTRSTLYVATAGAYQTSFAGGDYDAFLGKIQIAGKLSWATYLGGSGKDEGHAVIVDNSNNIYLGGLTHSTTGIATPGAYRTVLSGNPDAFLSKFSSSGVLQWSTYYGGKQEDQINALIADSKGNIYFSGYSTSDTGIATPGAYQDTLNNEDFYGGDAIVGQFRSNGILQWASYLGGPATDRAHGVGLGNKKELYIQGTCESTTSFASGSTIHQSVYGGGPSDGYVARWDTNGNFFWCSYYGGEGDDHGRGVVVDEEDNLYIIGWTDSDSAMGSFNGHQRYWTKSYSTDESPLSDAYLAKFSPNGSRLWGTYYGGTGRDQFKGIVLDKNNQFIYTIGLAASDDSISTPGAFQEVNAGAADAMVLKMNYDGERIWGTYIGGESSDKGQDIEIDPAGYVYGIAEESGYYPLTPGTNLNVYRGATDILVVKFNPYDQCLDPYENNETSQSGRKLNAYKDSTLYGYNGSISSANDQDWFKVKVTPGNNLKIILSALTKNYDLKLYNQLGQLTHESTNTGTADEVIIFNSIPAGNYNLNIAHTSTEFDANNCYRLQMILKNSAWLVREGELAPSIEPDFSAAATFFQDYFDVRITASNSADARVTLLNQFGQVLNEIETELTQGSQHIQLPGENLPAGIYYINIVCTNNTSAVARVVVVK